MSHNRSLREEQSQLETNLKLSNMPAEVRRETKFLLASAKEETQEEPREKPLSYESLSRNYPADKVARYFS